jgi:dTDP-4-dehydrorhamnose reductase
MKKILLTGANGLLGQKLVHLLAKQTEVQTIATARGEARYPLPETVIYKTLDITQEQAVEKLLATEKPDVVIHTAAMTQVDDCEAQQAECWLQNVEATRYLAKACELHNIFLLHLSTDFIFDGKEGPYKEDAQPNPLSYYGNSKWEAEKIVQQLATPWAIARTVLVFGISETASRSNIILWVKKSLEEGKNIKVVDDQWRTPTLAEDLAMGCWLIANQKATGIFNISGKEMLTPYDMAIATADFFKLDKSFITRTDASGFSQPAVRPPKTGFVIDKAREVLGYEPHSFMEGIEILAQQMNFL